MVRTSIPIDLRTLHQALILSELRTPDRSMAPTTEKTDLVVEKYEVVGDDLVKKTEKAAMGTVTISDTQDVILVPSPSSDPRG